MSVSHHPPPIKTAGRGPARVPVLAEVVTEPLPVVEDGWPAESAPGGWDRHRPRADTLLAQGVLAVAVLLAWARPALVGFATRRLSVPAGDPSGFEWALAWNLHAFTHGLNPFFTAAIGAPYGQDLRNGLTMPGVSLLVAPVTAVFGATAAYNIVVVLAIFLTAAAVFLLARELSGSAVGGTLAGLLVVLSPYFGGHGLGHLNLMWLFGLPYITYLAVRISRESMRPWAGAVGVAVTVLLTTGASVELLATETVFAVVGAGLAVLLTPAAHRRALGRALAALVVGTVAGLTLAAPILIAAVRGGSPAVPSEIVGLYSTDLVNVFSAGTVLQFPLGQHLPGLTGLHSSWSEDTAYLPIPLVLLVVAIVAWRRTRWTAGLLLFAAVTLILSFGPVLRVNGTATVPMPWALTKHLPAISAALPVRFTGLVYVALAVAVALLYAGARRRGRWVVAGAVTLTLAMTVPNLSAMGFGTNEALPVFVTSGDLEQVIARDENVLVMPAGEKGPGLAWQEDTGFWFRMPIGTGGGGSVPEAFRDPTAVALAQNNLDYEYRASLMPYLRKVGVRTVIVAADDLSVKKMLDAALPNPPTARDDVWIYRI